jgi:signal transduction histidine kinase
VTDDGIGLTQAWRPGVGLTSMCERAEQLGGTSPSRRFTKGGTTVHAVLPVASS